MEVLLLIIVLAFLFKTMDFSSGMGFGTTLTPSLFLLGYNPLQIVPTILISEAIIGFVGAFFDHEFKNVNFSFRPLSDATKLALYMGFFGCLAISISISLGYFVIKFPDYIIKTYGAILAMFMGIAGFLRIKLKKRDVFNPKPKMIFAFSALAGFNKGISGGGYGPLITMGQIFSGVYEKSATAIVSFSKAMVSLIGVFAFFLISYAGVESDLILLPSIFTGGYLAALAAPYMVRVLPNKIWKYFIPVYALGIGIFSLLKLFIP